MTTKTRFTFAATINPYGRGPGSNPNYGANLARAENATIRNKGRYISEEHEVCVHCGKRIRPGAHLVFAFLADMGEYMDAKDDNGCDLGFSPVGSDCARGLKKAGVPLYTADGEKA